jgi:hypothetical protein
MWGAGPTLSTIALPGAFPMSWAHEEGDLKNDVFGDEQKVGGKDVGIGGRGVVYLNKDWRGGARLNLGFGENGYRAQNFTLEVDKIFGGESGAHVFGGAGVGIGHMSFSPQGTGCESGACGNTWTTNEPDKLSVNDYLIRGQVGGYYRMKNKAVELAFFAALPWPSRQLIEVDTTADADPVKGGIYFQAGLEATMYFGDFTKPKDDDGGKKHKKNKKNKKNKN